MQRLHQFPRPAAFQKNIGKTDKRIHFKLLLVIEHAAA
jgi:hypothetical protein